MQILNKRLNVISAFIEKKDKVIDIGCDHALLAISLYINNKQKIISSDINELPLLKAKENFSKYHIDDLELRCGNGLDPIDDNIDTIVISGMGAVTMCQILNNINNYPNIKKVIISPNNDFKLTRKLMHKKNFKVIEEKIVLENNKYYLVSVYEKGKDKIDYFFGNLDLNNVDTINYYKYLYNKNNNILKEIPKRYLYKRMLLIKENYKIKKNIKI